MAGENTLHALPSGVTGFAPFTAPDGEAFEVVRRAGFGFFAMSLRTGELVAFASDGQEAVEVERLPRRSPRNGAGAVQ